MGPSASPRVTMAQVLLRAHTLSTFLTDVSRLSHTTPTILTDTWLRSPTPESPLTLRLSLLPTPSTLPPLLPTLPLWLWDKLLWILFMKVIYFMKNIAQSEH